MKGMKPTITSVIVFLLLFSSLFTAPASASTASANLKVTIVETNPYPAKIGEYLDLTVQVENIGRDRAENVDIELVPEYPFSLDSQENTVQNIGSLAPGKFASKEFHLFVDKNAKKGVRSIDIRTKTDEGDPWS